MSYAPNPYQLREAELRGILAQKDAQIARLLKEMDVASRELARTCAEWRKELGISGDNG